MRRLPPHLSALGTSPARTAPLSAAPISDQGQRLTDIQAIQRLFANSENGGYWPADPTFLYEDSAGTTLASLNGVVGLWANNVTGKPNAVQATTANKPYLRRTPVSNKVWLDSNTETGALTATFSSSLGSACTIATVGAEGVTIAENQTIETTYNIAQTFGYNGDVLVINRVLTASEKALVTRVLSRNVPTLGPELLPNADLSSGEGWVISSAISPSWVFSNGQAVLSPIASASGIQVNGVCKVNGQYLFSATVTAFSSGLWYYGAIGYPPPQYNIGHYTKANVATSTDFRVFGSANTSLMVDSVSAKEIL